jgi:hypothetical protein
MFKFLQAAMSLARKGVKQEDILKFAKQEFGEVSDELKNIISRIYSRAKSQGSRIKDQEKGEVVPFKKKKEEGIMSNVTDRLAAEAKKLEQMMKDLQPGVSKSPARSGGPLDPRKGMVRTGARQFLQKEAREGRLKILDDRERDAITKGYQGGVDPIEVLRKYYGEDALEQIDLVSDELMDAQTYDEVLEILNKADMKRFKARDIPGYDPNVRSSERIMKELEEKAKGNKAREDSLEDIKNFFKDDDPEDFATGGRVGYAFGTGKKLLKLFGGKKKLEKAIKEAVDDLIPTGDPKLDADMAIDNMLENYNIDRDAVDQYDIIDAYGKAYDELKLPIVNQLKNKRKPSVDEEQYYNVRNSVFDEVDVELEKQFPGVTKEIQSSKSVERLKLMEKYPGIDEKLLDNIINDPDPQHKAEVLAVLDEAMTMGQKGMDTEKIIEVLKSTSRTKQAEGGLSYLMGM